MKVLKTIVATAVIVFAMTTVAMAGVQHFTKAQDEQAVDKTPARYAVTLTAMQAAHLSDDQPGSHVAEAQRTKTHARYVHREHTQAQHKAQQGAHEAEAQHMDRIRSSVQSGSGGQSGSHHYEPTHQTHASSGSHDGGHGGGHGGD